MTEYVRLVDAGAIEVLSVPWCWAGVVAIGVLMVWLVWSAAVARAKVGRGHNYTRGRR